MNVFHYLTRFKMIINRYCQVSYSQCGEDLILFHLCRAISLDKPTYLDIGAYHPFHISNTALFYELGSRGVNVEPNPEASKLFQKYRSQDINLTAGVSDSAKVMTYYCFNIATLNTFSKKEADKCIREGYLLEDRKKIPVTTLQKIISEQCHGVMPDILLIDAEGSERKIILSLKKLENKPAILCIETVTFTVRGLGEKKRSLINQILEMGYKIYADTFINTIFLKGSYFSK